ncbi:MAG: DoxX family membrane protein, partial [Parcubacteria group bacterium]|nr:DoxX family membrane protein [Parcubacteria group bacterium]
MSKISLHIIRIGLAIVFLWIGVSILRFPEAWGGYLQPWAVKLLPVPIEQMMIGTGFLDIIIGLLLLCNIAVWIAAGVGSLHLLVVLFTAGVTDITVRDIGLLA